MALIVTLIVLGLFLMAAEVILPGGILGAIGALTMALAVGIGFSYGTGRGFSVLGIALVGSALMVYAWFKLFPKSVVGKQVFLQRNGREWHGYDRTQQALLGKEGVAHSMLRPAGVAMIESKRVDVVTRGEMIDPGQAIRVVEVQGNRVVVEAVAPGAPGQAT